MNGTWSQSEISLILVEEAAEAIRRQPPSQEDSKRLDRYRRFERELFLADVARTPPDIVIVDETWTANSAFVDASVKHWLEDFHVSASTTVLLADGPRLLSMYTRVDPD